MKKGKVLVIKPGQKFLHKATNTVYVVTNVEGKTVTLSSEGGKSSMLLQIDSLALGNFEPLYD